MTRRRRVCFVLPSLNGGGAERAAVAILNGMDAAAWDRSMYLFKREGPYLGEIAASVALSSGGDQSRYGRIADLRRYFRETQPDVIVSFLSFASVLLAARLARGRARVVFNQQTPVSAFLDDADYHWRRPWHRRLFRAVTRLAYGRADLVVATSHGVSDDLRDHFGMDGARMRVVHNPVDLDAIARAVAEPIDAAVRHVWDPPVIVTAGRLAEAKNIPLLIDAMALLRARVPAQLVILGQGDQEALIRARIAHHQLTGCVHLLGFQQNPWRYFAQADAFVLTSRYEGFGNVLIEAMACGVPVVATASPGTREIIEHDVNGLLVEEHTAAGVASALEQVVTDQTRHATLAAGARASVAQYALPVIAREYESLFREIAA
jgi:glycosyltransferase involved in cell wall biosynthesis